MYIKELEIDNFKSFANNITVPFLQGFTTISGPNGSGKSNIIDSILFALGLSTSRGLRAEKLFHLISTHTKRNEAYVKVVFEPENNEEEKITVARRIKKSSQGYNSTYYLNDKIVTLAEVHIELEKYNITPNSYNVMMQGDVTSITNCSSNERRKIIDEIAGIADFDRRIEQAQNELNTVEQRVEKSNFILSEVDFRIGQLFEEREQALKYQKLKEDKMKLESQITTVKYFDLKRSSELVHQNILDAQKNKKDKDVKLEKLNQNLKVIQEKYDEISRLVKEKGEAEQIEVKKQAEEIKGRIEAKKGAINFADKNIQDNLKAVENAKNGIEILNSKIEDTKKEIEDKKCELELIEVNKKKENAELVKILEELSSLNQTADEYLTTRNKIRKELEEKKDAEVELEKEKLPLESEFKTLQKELVDTKIQLEELHEWKLNYNSNKDKLEIQVEQLSKELEDYKIAQMNIINELDKTKTEISDVSYNIRAAGTKISQLEAKKYAYEESSLGRAIETILGAKLNGVHAPLVQLGQVDERYSVALETAMGGRMKYIPVDDDYVAKQAIEILKTARAGRATFLPLNKINKAPKNLKLPKEKGVIDFAINLIDFDDKYIDAFFLALNETIVVEDYSSAQKLIGKYRMVTLQGEIFDRNSSISGGENSRVGLKFSQTQDDELEKYKQRFTAFEKKLNALEEQKILLENKQDKIRNEYSQIMTQHTLAKGELNSLFYSSKKNEDLLVEKTQRLKELEPNILTLENKLDKYEEKQVEINQKILLLQEEFTKIEAQMSSEELEKLKASTSSVEERIKKIDTQINDLNNVNTALEHDIRLNEELIKTKIEQIDRLSNDNKEIEQDKLKYEEEIKGFSLQVLALDEKIKELGEKLVELQFERDKINNELLENSKEKNNIENDLERIIEQIESFKARRRELEPQLEDARQELFNAGVDINKLIPVEISVEEITTKISRLQKKMEELEPVNMRAIMDYDRVLARKQELETQINTLEAERKQILERTHGYEKQKKEEFLTTYKNINDNFKSIFAKLSDGEGTLILENFDDPFNGGLTIEAQPRDKKKQRLESMSGGEKSLTALAFVFAIQKYMPAPFYAFDEVDMHLDGINVEKLAEMIKIQSENTQFIVVSLRKPMVESANRTIGVTQKEKGITKLTGVKLRD